MEYRYATRRDESDLASGSVLRSVPGRPAFPVRLAVELFHRSLAHLPDDHGPVTLWDPVCGAGQLAATLGFRCRAHLRTVVATDIEPEAVELARANLALLTRDGLAARRAALAAQAASLGRESYQRAVEAAERLDEVLDADGGDLPSHVALVDAFDTEAIAELAGTWQPDLVFADVPHGALTSWQGAGDDALERFLLTLGGALPRTAVLTVVARARRVRLPEGVTAAERLRAGHRAAVIVQAGALADRV